SLQLGTPGPVGAIPGQLQMLAVTGWQSVSARAWPPRQMAKISAQWRMPGWLAVSMPALLPRRERRNCCDDPSAGRERSPTPRCHPQGGTYPAVARVVDRRKAGLRCRMRSLLCAILLIGCSDPPPKITTVTPTTLCANVENKLMLMGKDLHPRK